jgi:hypothetical protein
MVPEMVYQRLLKLAEEQRKAPTKIAGAILLKVLIG